MFFVSDKLYFKLREVDFAIFFVFFRAFYPASFCVEQFFFRAFETISEKLLFSHQH